MTFFIIEFYIRGCSQIVDIYLFVQRILNGGVKGQ